MLSKMGFFDFGSKKKFTFDDAIKQLRKQLIDVYARLHQSKDPDDDSKDLTHLADELDSTLSFIVGLLIEEPKDFQLSNQSRLNERIGPYLQELLSGPLLTKVTDVCLTIKSSHLRFSAIKFLYKLLEASPSVLIAQERPLRAVNAIMQFTCNNSTKLNEREVKILAKLLGTIRQFIEQDASLINLLFINGKPPEFHVFDAALALLALPGKYRREIHDAIVLFCQLSRTYPELLSFIRDSSLIDTIISRLQVGLAGLDTRLPNKSCAWAVSDVTQFRGLISYINTLQLCCIVLDHVPPDMQDTLFRKFGHEIVDAVMFPAIIGTFPHENLLSQRVAISDRDQARSSNKTTVNTHRARTNVMESEDEQQALSDKVERVTSMTCYVDATIRYCTNAKVREILILKIIGYGEIPDTRLWIKLCQNANPASVDFDPNCHVQMHCQLATLGLFNTLFFSKHPLVFQRAAISFLSRQPSEYVHGSQSTKEHLGAPPTISSLAKGAVELALHPRKNVFLLDAAIEMEAPRAILDLKITTHQRSPNGASFSMYAFTAQDAISSCPIVSQLSLRNKILSQNPESRLSVAPSATNVALSHADQLVYQIAECSSSVNRDKDIAKYNIYGDSSSRSNPAPPLFMRNFVGISSSDRSSVSPELSYVLAEDDFEADSAFLSSLGCCFERFLYADFHAVLLMTGLIRHLAALDIDCVRTYLFEIESSKSISYNNHYRCSTSSLRCSSPTDNMCFNKQPSTGFPSSTKSSSTMTPDLGLLTSILDRVSRKARQCFSDKSVAREVNRFYRGDKSKFYYRKKSKSTRRRSSKAQNQSHQNPLHNIHDYTPQTPLDRRSLFRNESQQEISNFDDGMSDASVLLHVSDKINDSELTSDILSMWESESVFTDDSSISHRHLLQSSTPMGAKPQQSMSTNNISRYFESVSGDNQVELAPVVEETEQQSYESNGYEKQCAEVSAVKLGCYSQPSYVLSSSPANVDQHKSPSKTVEYSNSVSRKLALRIVLFDEFVKEMAAFALEHSLLIVERASRQ